jgi:hypothetical protein
VSTLLSGRRPVRIPWAARAVIAVMALASAVQGCGGAAPAIDTGADPKASFAGDPAVVLAAGDIASCASDGDEATAAIVAARPGAVVATLGDHVYDAGTAAEFRSCYTPTWGAFRNRTKPAVGNHELFSRGGRDYREYFGSASGGKSGYYSYDLGSWHIVVLNSNCSTESCAAGGAQERWLRLDLTANPARCTLAYWHHPRFSSGASHGSTLEVAPLWQALADHGADVVLAAHEHNYERFVPLDRGGRPDPEHGIRSFVVGTGGRSHYGFGQVIDGSEVRNDDTFGVLQLVLSTEEYNWQFLPVAGGTFTDVGSGRCS